MKRIHILYSILICFSPLLFSQEVEIIGDLKLINGSEGEDKILTSDSGGIAAWKDARKPLVDVQSDFQTRNFGNTWGQGPVFNTINGFKANSKVKITYHVPTSNNDMSWGGAYIEPQISFDDGNSWNSLGSTGYDGGVMVDGSAVRGSITKVLLIDPNQSSNFSVKIRIYYKSYSGTLIINGNHSINNISNTAPLLSGTNGRQHYTNVIVEEVF